MGEVVTKRGGEGRGGDREGVKGEVVTKRGGDGRGGDKERG